MTAPVVIMAGGTGGHIFPGLAVAQELVKSGEQVHWIGGTHGLEGTLIPGLGIPLHLIAVRGLRGKRGIARFFAPIRLVWSVLQSIYILMRLRPKVCVGFGGYPAGPGGLAARILGIPLVIHEQNAIAGLTNRYLAKFANKVLTAFPGVLPGGECVGNPIRPEIDQVGLQRIKNLYQPTNQTRILILGGSQGAHALNQNLPAKIREIADKYGITITHQTGDAGLESVTEQYAAMNLDATVIAFINPIARAYQKTDIVVCRAGALTVSELAAAAMPSVLIPFPNAVDDHQTKNGEQLVALGAAVIIQETELDIFVAKLSDILRSPANLIQMAQSARNASRPDAAVAVAHRVLEASHG